MRKRRFLVVATDGYYSQTWETSAGSAKDVREKILNNIAANNYMADWDPRSYRIYEIVGRAHEIDDEAVDAASEIRNKRLREEAKSRHEAQERADLERLRSKYG